MNLSTTPPSHNGYLWSVNAAASGTEASSELIRFIQVDEDLLRKQQAVYSVPGVDEEVRSPDVRCPFRNVYISPHARLQQHLS